MKPYLGLFAVAVVGLAQAHAHLLNATPADGSTLVLPPASFALTFNEAATLTSLSLKKGTAAAHKITDLPAKPSAQFDIPAPKMDPGSYTLSYRVLSDDNHIMSGAIKFTITAAK